MKSIVLARVPLVLLLLMTSIVVRADWFGLVEDEENRIQIQSAFMEVHSGPGRGYPVFYIAEKNESVTLLKARTGWLKVQLQDGTEGWVEKQTLAEVVSPTAINLAFYRDSGWGMFAAMMIGRLDEASEMGIVVGNHFTKNISAELLVTQVLGSFSESRWYGVQLSHQPFPEWRVSPYFSIGGGWVDILPKATLAKEKKRREDTVFYGAGIRSYLSAQYFVQAEYRENIAFTERDDNELASEWRLGIGLDF